MLLAFNPSVVVSEMRTTISLHGICLVQKTYRAQPVRLNGAHGCQWVSLTPQERRNGRQIGEKKERRWKVVVEKREETREESKRCIWRPAVAQGHHHRRLNVSLCEILRIVEVVTVKSPHNLCRIFNHVTSRFKRYQWLPTSYKVKDKMFDNHST